MKKSTIIQQLFCSILCLLLNSSFLMGQVENKKMDLSPNFECSEAFFIMDLDIDSNMDDNPNNDEDFEMQDRAIIIDVNNDSDILGDGIDNQDNIINGINDQNELTSLILRGTNGVIPVGHKVILKVSDNSKLRIFNNHGEGVIGPNHTWGGPNINEYEVPNADIEFNDLEYFIEGIEHGRVNIELSLTDFSGNIISSDFVKVAINVDKLPGEGHDHVRNRVIVVKSRNNLEGVEAKLDGSSPLITWGLKRPRSHKTSSYWVSIQRSIPNFGVNAWLQTGVRREELSDSAIPTNRVYMECVSNYSGYLNGTDPNGYRFFFKVPLGWIDRTYKVEVTNVVIGEAQAYCDNVAWETYTHAAFQETFSSYQIGTEIKQSIARTPGNANDKSLVSLAKYKDDTGWNNTNFNANNLKIKWYDGRGEVSTATASPTASLGEFECRWLNGKSFEHWDKREW